MVKVKVIKVPIPVDPVPQKFTYVIELEATQARFLRGLLRHDYGGSLTAAQIIDGLNEAGLG
ncbi:hypothetical protein LCGC14_0474260 [marine sediment metagenome]|uniref:Uncharacterized protein n=1 Tax=marine sediment metagenome TaxID=412755 RepID=A0A0F9UY26_9ZZZZ